MDLPQGLDIQMLEAMLAQVQNGAVGNQMYDDIHDEDDEDYDDDEEDDDEEDDYYQAAGGDQHSIGMFQNPYGGGGAGGGGGGGAGEEEGMQGLLQGLLNMSGAAGLAEMGGGMASMVSGMMGGSPMDGGGAGPGGFDTSMIPGILGTLGAAAANGIVDGFNGGGGGGNGATLREYDEDEDDDEEEITEASESDDEDEEESDEDDEEHHHNGAHMAAMAAMGGMGAGAGAAAMAAMMNQSHLQQHPSQQMQMYDPHSGRPMMQHGSPYMMSASAAHQAMFSPTTSTSSAPLSLPPGASQPPQSSASSMSGFAAAAVATAAAAAAAAMSLPSSSPAPAASVAASNVPSSAVISPPVATISSGMGGGTMSRVDPLAALVAGGTAAAMGGMVMGKMVSTLSNNSGGGTALVKTEHVYAATPGYATLPPSTMHKSLDELNKLSDGMSMARISSMPMQSPHSQAMHAALSHQHLAQIHHPGQANMMYPKQFMPHPMMLRPPVSRSSQMMPHHGAVMPDAAGVNGNRNDGDKTSLDRESVPCSETSGGGKSDTESTTKKTPSPTMVGPGRVSPDSSSESSSSGSSDRGHVKNATSMGSLSDLQSATESMRDSDTDNHMERHQIEMQMRRRLHAMEHDSLVAGNAIMSGAVPLLIETPNYGWSSLVGHENAKDALKNLFLGKKFPEVFDSQGSCRGVLLFGPSGAGKTSLARSLACEAGGAKLIACTPSLISNRNFHPHAAALLVRQMFDHARVYKPCVMLMDEIERLALPELTEAEKAAKAELMAQVRGETTIQPAYPPNANPKSINDHVMLVATTCSPWMLPEELRRLFAYNIHIKLPGEKQREELFRMFLNNYANNVTADHYKCLLSKSEGYSAADINTVVRQAASYNPQSQPAGPNQLHQNHPRVVTYDDLASAMTNYRCSCKPEDLAYYMKYIQEATHRTEDIREDEDKKKPKGVKKIGRLAKSFAAAVISVID